MENILPIRMKNLQEFLERLEPILEYISEEDNKDLLKLINDKYDDIITIIVLGTEKDKSWVEEQTIDELIDLINQILKVNRGLFYPDEPVKITGQQQKRQQKKKPKKEKLWWYDWVVRLVSNGFSYESVLEMRWPDAKKFLDACTNLEAERVLHIAIAARASRAEEKSWVEWVHSLT